MSIIIHKIGKRFLISYGIVMFIFVFMCPGWTQKEAKLPDHVKVVWDLNKAFHEATATRERICLNGLWRWQPADPQEENIPASNWGFFKVPGYWPGYADYMHKESQILFAHPSWQNKPIGDVMAAWQQREITIPASWAGRRITLYAEYVNSFATVYLDGQKAGEIRFPAGEVELTALCRPGATHILSLHVVAMPLKAVMLSFSDTNAAKQVAGRVQRRGLCGDVYLVSTPLQARIRHMRIDTSVRKGQITFQVSLEGLIPAMDYTLQAQILEQNRSVATFTSRPFRAADLQEGQISFSASWKPDKLWDLHTPQNQFIAAVSLREATGKIIDTAFPERFGFREFWIEGRDFYLNGSRIYLSALPLDNAQMNAWAASYEGAKESLQRYKKMGINFMYTHNYGCEPGSHLSFAEILRAADDVGMLIALSQPHFSAYEWNTPNADQTNGYARDAAFYVQVAGSHPSVVCYATSHNATGYAEDMNPDLLDGRYEPDAPWTLRNRQYAARAEKIIQSLDPSRIVYHHSSGNFGTMHTSNFYVNMAPAQELDEWFGAWAANGKKPMFTCEYMVPCTWDFTMYRGWYHGGRAFGSAIVPWEFCSAEWSAQFLGDQAYQLQEEEKANIRWEAERFRQGNLWHRWDYPHQVGRPVFTDQQKIIGQYLQQNWRAYRTWGVSAISPWEYGAFWRLRPDVDKSRRNLPVDWGNLQRPGFSADFLEDQREIYPLGYREEDFVPTPAGEAVLRNNQPLLAYIGGKPEAFTSKDHNFYPGERLSKQFIVINNSRRPVSVRGQWTLNLPQPLKGEFTVENLPTGEQRRLPVHIALPNNVRPGQYILQAEFKFNTGEIQTDSFRLHVLQRPLLPSIKARLALYDPRGETKNLLTQMNIPFTLVEPTAEGEGFDVLVIGKRALTPEGPGIHLMRVRQGLKVIVFEQTKDTLEKRLGFRTAEYGLRNVFIRVPNHPLVSGLTAEALQNWRGEATLTPPRLEYKTSQRYGGPAIFWCGVEVPQVWRCGNRGNVASVLIEKPSKGDFLPILDGGFSLQYSPLLEYREGAGLVLFCQLDVTGRTEAEPAAEILMRNILDYVAAWQPPPRRQAMYVGDRAGQQYFQSDIQLLPYNPEQLNPEHTVLIVGTGGGAQLAQDKERVRAFLQNGGYLLALGLDEQEAHSFLPISVKMKRAEHLNCYFEAPPASSPFAGLSPADVHNRAPRELPLITEGANVIGNGVLAEAAQGRIVFFQLPPYTVTRSKGELPSLRVDPQEAQEGQKSALLTLGAITGRGTAFGQIFQKPPIEVGKRYTFAVFVKPISGPVKAHLEIERPVRPWDRALRGQEVELPAGQWTELHETFTVDRPFGEGWNAYFVCAEEGAQLRLDNFRLYQGDYVPGGMAAGAQNFFANGGFEEGDTGWRFIVDVQHNLRRTYRRTAYALTRLLANMGVAAPTPLLDYFGRPITPIPPETQAPLSSAYYVCHAQQGSVPVSDGEEQRWKKAFYVDEPEDWDYPYRFFRW